MCLCSNLPSPHLHTSPPQVYGYEQADGAGKASDIVIQGFIRAIAMAAIPVVLCGGVLYILVGGRLSVPNVPPHPLHPPHPPFWPPSLISLDILIQYFVAITVYLALPSHSSSLLSSLPSPPTPSPLLLSPPLPSPQLVESDLYSFPVFAQVMLVNMALNQTWVAILICVICAFPTMAFRISPVLASVAGFASGFFIPTEQMPNWWVKPYTYILGLFVPLNDMFQNM